MATTPDRELQLVIEQALEDGRIRGLQDALLAVDLAAELDVTPAVIIGKLLEKAEGREPTAEERAANATRWLERASDLGTARCLYCGHRWDLHRGAAGCSTDCGCRRGEQR